MNDFFPPYRQGQSLAGYIQYCSQSRGMMRDVDNISVRRNLCRDHAEKIREALSRP
jgi:hypothetical protein